MTSSPIGRTSVVIPAFNAESYLSDAVNSVLEQSLPAAQVVVVDDGSTDATPEIAKSFPIVTYVRQTNAGVAAALNHGCRIATGDFIAFLSADDVWKNNKLALQHRALQGVRNKLVFGHMAHFLSPELTGEEVERLVCPAEPMPAFSAGTLLTRLDTFHAVGPLNEEFAVGEFMDWYGRAEDLGVEITMLAETVSLRRVHPNNHSTKSLRRKSYAPVLKALLDRRRAGQV